MSKFELNPKVNELGNSNFTKTAHIRKTHSRPATQSTRLATVRRIKIREITSN